MSRLTESVRRAYEAFVEDPASLWDHLHEDAVFHVSGDHPLSGDYAGPAEIQGYLTSVREAHESRARFSVTSALSDESVSEILVEGMARHRDGPDAHTIVHRLRIRDGKLVEFSDHPFDQQAEDRYWKARVPQQRAGQSARSSEGGPPAVIPVQPTNTHITKG